MNKLTLRHPALQGGLLALMAAVLFGISTPLVQRAGSDLGPFTTAALLYCGAALIGVLLRRALDGDTTRTAIGVDITSSMLRQAAERLPSDVPLICASSENMPLSSASVDVVVSTSVLHYMHNPIRMLS